MAVTTGDSLSKIEVESILETFSQLKTGGKLCFKGNEVCIESASSVLRTASSLAGYFTGSEWSRDVNNLSSIIKKISTLQLDGLITDDYFVLANKVDSAIKGLMVLEKNYPGISKGKQKEVVSQAVLSLRQFYDKVESFNDRLKSEIEELAQGITLRDELFQKVLIKTEVILSESVEPIQVNEVNDAQSEQLNNPVAEELERAASELEPVLEEIEKRAIRSDSENIREQEFFELLSRRQQESAEDQKANRAIMEKWGISIPPRAPQPSQELLTGAVNR